MKCLCVAFFVQFIMKFDTADIVIARRCESLLYQGVPKSERCFGHFWDSLCDLYCYKCKKKLITDDIVISDIYNGKNLSVTIDGGSQIAKNCRPQQPHSHLI